MTVCKYSEKDFRNSKKYKPSNKEILDQYLKCRERRYRRQKRQCVAIYLRCCPYWVTVFILLLILLHDILQVLKRKNELLLKNGI